MVSAALTLFALSFTELTAAAEETFGPNRHYSVQLPQGWVSTLDEKDNTLGATGPGSVTLNAMVATTQTSPEGLMEKIITNSEQKKAGYKLLEKGTVTSKSGHKAHLHRYQLDSKDGPQMWIDYFFQLTDKEVVVLVFAFPMNSATPPKKEIQSMFDSVKVTANASKDESWTDSNSSSADSKPASRENSDLAGTYAGGNQTMTLKPDGTFVAKDENKSFTGTYTRSGAILKFTDSHGETFRLEIDQGALLNSDGTRLVKKTQSANEPRQRDETAPAAPKTTGTRITFATNCSVELPAGWTGKVVGEKLQAKGPNGATLEGTSIDGVDLPEIMALRAVSFKTKVTEVDKDEVSTAAGAKGKLVYYRYDDKGGPTAEIDVFIKTPKQVVTLKFIAPNSPTKLDSNFSRAVEQIYSSLKTD